METAGLPPAEFRTVAVDWPASKFLGTSSDVLLTFNPEKGPISGTGTATLSIATTSGQPTDTSEPGRKFKYFGQIAIPDVFATHFVYASARLDAVGLSLSPEGDTTYPVRLGESLTWRWSVKPLEAERQKLIISLRLQFSPKGDAPPLDDLPLWSDSFGMEVTKGPLGLTTSQASLGSAALATLGGSRYSFLCGRKSQGGTLKGRRSGKRHGNRSRGDSLRVEAIHSRRLPKAPQAPPANCWSG